MLQNPSFEGEYTVRIFNEVKVAQGWEPFYKEGGSPPDGGQRPCVRPEYKPLTLSVDPNRVIDGSTAQGWFVRWNVMDAGVYQRVTVPINKGFDLSVYAQAWCSDRDDPRLSDGEMYFALGVDLNGGTNPWADYVIWTPWRWINETYKEFRIEGQTKLSEMTVFCRSWNKWKLKHCDCYVDLAELAIENSNGSSVGEARVRELAREEIADALARWITAT